MKKEIELPKIAPVFYVVTDHLDVLRFTIINARDVDGETLACETKLLTTNPTEQQVYLFNEYTKKMYLTHDFTLRNNVSKNLFTNRHEAFEYALNLADEEAERLKDKLNNILHKRDLLSVGKQ